MMLEMRRLELCLSNRRMTIKEKQGKAKGESGLRAKTEETGLNLSQIIQTARRVTIYS